MRHAKSVAALTLFLAAVILGAAFGATYLFHAAFTDTAFLIGLAVLLAGLYLSMRGIVLGNKVNKLDNDQFTMDTLEAEREQQNIQSQGNVNYVRNNRTIGYRPIPFAMALSGIVTLVVSYLNA